jgi:RNA polymerase sigma-70 factor (ECF subfamily)
VTGFEGFEQWFRAEHPRLVGSLIAVDGNVEAARDAAAEAFARALVHWPRVQAMEWPGAWLYRVGLNVQRRRLRRAELEARLLRGGRRGEPATLPEPAIEVWEAVRRLPRQQRAVVVLTYVADLTQAEIAEILGVRRGTVASHLSDARAALALALDPGGR